MHVHTFFFSHPTKLYFMVLTIAHIFFTVPDSPGGVAYGREPHVPDWVSWFTDTVTVLANNSVSVCICCGRIVFLEDEVRCKLTDTPTASDV